MVVDGGYNLSLSPIETLYGYYFCCVGTYEKTLKKRDMEYVHEVERRQ